MKLTHPKSPLVVDVADGSEGIYVSQGWMPVAEPAPLDEVDEGEPDDEPLP